MSELNCPICHADAGGHTDSCPVADRVELTPAGVDHAGTILAGDVELSGTDVPVYLGEGPDRVLVGRGDVAGNSVSMTLDVDVAGFAARGPLAASFATSPLEEAQARMQATIDELSAIALKLGPRLEPEHQSILERALAEYSPQDPGHVRLRAALLECPDCRATGLRQDDAFWIAVDAVADELMSIDELRKLPRCARCNGEGFIS